MRTNKLESVNIKLLVVVGSLLHVLQQLYFMMSCTRSIRVQYDGVRQKTKSEKNLYLEEKRKNEKLSVTVTTTSNGENYL